MGLGDFVSNIFGSTNEFQAKAPDLDPNAYQYGGHAGGAEEAAALQGARAQRSTVTANQLQAQQGQMFGRGNESLDQAGQARNEQLGALGLARARATDRPEHCDDDGRQVRAKARGGTGFRCGVGAWSRGPRARAAERGGEHCDGHGRHRGSDEHRCRSGATRGRAVPCAAGGGLRQGDVGQAQTAFGAGAQSGQLAIGNQQVGQVGRDCRTTSTRRSLLRR